LTPLDDILALADDLYAHGHHEAVVAALIGAIESGHDAAPVRLLLARCLLATDNRDIAKLHLSRCISLDPGCGAAFRLLAEIAMQHGDPAAAEVLIHDALESDPADPRSLDLAERIDHDIRPPRRRAFGSYLVHIGVLAPHELHAAMDYHRRLSVRVGDAARALGLASGPKLEWAALAYHAGWRRAA
jgi:tetratricopeptide (TPR) repeat protein